MNSMDQTTTVLLACVSHTLFSPNTWKLMETYSEIVNWIYVCCLHLIIWYRLYASKNVCDLIFSWLGQCKAYSKMTCICEDKEYFREDFFFYLPANF